MDYSSGLYLYVCIICITSKRQGKWKVSAISSMLYIFWHKINNFMESKQWIEVIPYCMLVPNSQFKCKIIQHSKSWWSKCLIFSRAKLYCCSCLGLILCLREIRDKQFLGDILFLLGPSKHLRKAFNQCCFNVRPASPSLAHHWEITSSNNFHRVCWGHYSQRLSWRCRWRNFAALGEGLSN